LRARLSAEFGASRVILTDSGTSALAVAMRIAVSARPTSRRILLPAYACPDLLTAIEAAEAEPVLYDIDPATLGPDLDDLRRQLQDGAAAVVAAHLYGVPVDIPAVRAVMQPTGALLIEDAAQGVGGLLDGRPLGAHGDLAILSFGRGKGRTGGEGGACLVRDATLDVVATSVAHRLSAAASGHGAVLRSTVQWLLARPSAYGIVAVLAGGRLGRTQYHAPSRESLMSTTAAAIVEANWLASDAESRYRRMRAAVFVARVTADKVWHVPMSRAGNRAEAGYLRVPVFGTVSVPPAMPALGVLPAYPRTLGAYPESVASQGAARSCPGAEALTKRLVTVPVHSRVTARASARLLARFLEPA